MSGAGNVGACCAQSDADSACLCQCLWMTGALALWEQQVMYCCQHLVPGREISVTCNLPFYFPARSGTSLQCKSQLDKFTHLDLQEKKKIYWVYALHLSAAQFPNSIPGPKLALQRELWRFWRPFAAQLISLCFPALLFLHFVLLLLFQAVHELFVSTLVPSSSSRKWD